MPAQDDLKTFLSAVITTDEGWLCILKGPNVSDPEEWFRWPDDYEKVVTRILEIQDTNAYFSPHLFKDKKSVKANVCETRTIVADLDNADITDLTLDPTFLVETSTGRHQGFWVIDEALPADEFEQLSKQLSYTIPNCDRSGWSLGHRFRLPGTRNYKYDPPGHVRLLISSERVYTVDEMRAWVGDTDVANPIAKVDDEWINNPPGDFGIGPRQLLEKYKDAIGTKAFSYFGTRQSDRSEALWALQLALFRAGASREEVYWIAKHSVNNKFETLTYSRDRELAKDVVRAETAETVDKRDVQTVIRLAQKSQGSPNERKLLVTKIVIADMLAKGDFMTTEDGRYWYLQRTAGRPLLLGKRSDQLEAYLDNVYGLNPADGFQPYVVNHLIAYTISKGRRAVTGVLSKYMGESLLLHSGKADVYNITPENVTRHPDGQFGVLFPWRGAGEEPITIGQPLDEPDWVEWMLEGWFTNLLDLSPEQAKALVRVWVLFIVFKDLAPSRPILALLGQPGSGKSTLFKLIYILFYGRLKSLNSVSTPEDFDFLVASDPLAVFDNVDSWTTWLPDRLALSAASSDLVKRKLYTDSDTVTLKRQSILGITAHDPRFGRADVIDRMIILNFSRRPYFLPEGHLQERVHKQRDRLWGSIVQDIQKVLAEPDPNLQDVPEFRISDFARVGLRIARAVGVEELFREAILTLRQSQTAFNLAEEALLVDVIKRWQITRNGSTPEYASVPYLYDAFSNIEPGFTKTYKNASVLARRLWTVQSNLKSVFEIEFKYDSNRGVKTWRIDPINNNTGKPQSGEKNNG